MPYLDAVNVDIKSSEDKFYKQYCGARVENVLESARDYYDNGVWVELTTLAIPTLTDKEEMFTKIAKFIKTDLSENVPWHISAFSG